VGSTRPDVVNLFWSWPQFWFLKVCPDITLDNIGACPKMLKGSNCPRQLGHFVNLPFRHPTKSCLMWKEQKVCERKIACLVWLRDRNWAGLPQRRWLCQVRLKLEVGFTTHNRTLRSFLKQVCLYCTGSLKKTWLILWKSPIYSACSFTNSNLCLKVWRNSRLDETTFGSKV